MMATVCVQREPDMEVCSVTNGGEWADFIIRSKVGDPNGLSLVVDSSFGVMGYTWINIGSRNWWDFLFGLDFDYAMQKMLHRDLWHSYSAELATKEVRSSVVFARRHCEFQKEAARQIYDEIPFIAEEAFTAEELLRTLYSRWEASLSDSDWWYSMNLVEWRPCWRRFWSELWGPFVQTCRRFNGIPENSYSLETVDQNG